MTLGTSAIKEGTTFSCCLTASKETAGMNDVFADNPIIIVHLRHIIYERHTGGSGQSASSRLHHAIPEYCGINTSSIARYPRTESSLSFQTMSP